METLYFVASGNLLAPDPSATGGAKQVTSNSVAAHRCVFTIIKDSDLAWTATFLAADGTPYRVALSDGAAAIPKEVTATDGQCAVGLYAVSGDATITTNLCVFQVVEGCPTSGSALGDVSSAVSAAMATANSAAATTLPDGVLCTMHFKMEGNQLTQAYQAGDTVQITSNSVHAHICAFDLDDPSMQWVAVFGTGDGSTYVALVEDGQAVIPAEVTAVSGPITMGLFAAAERLVRTTNLVRLDVVEGCPTDALVPAADETGLYQQLLDKIAVLSLQVEANITASTDADADYAAEVVDARVDFRQKTYGSLGAHLRAIDGQLGGVSFSINENGGLRATWEE